MRVLYVAAGLLAGLGAAGSAGAQSWEQLREQARRCDNADGTLPPAAVIGSCTALIESGRLQAPALAAAHTRRGSLRAEQNDPQGARADLDQAIRLNPNEAQAYVNRGNLRAEQNDPQGARADLDQAIRLSPNDARAHLWRGILRAQQDDPAGARADYDRAIQLSPNLAPAYHARALLRGSRGDRAGAAADYREVVRLAPDNATARNGVCWNMALAGEDLDRARVACDAALRLSPNNAEYLDSRGLVGLKQRRYQAAWADYDAAVRLDPDRAHYRYGRGLAALRLGRRAEGEADIAAARARDGTVAEQYRSYGLTP